MALFDVGVTYEEAEKEAQFPVVPKGDYKFQVTKWDAEQTKLGDPMIRWTFEIIEHAQHNGVLLFYRTPLQGKGRNFLTRFAMACMKPWPGTQFDPDSYLGCVVIGSVSESLYQGRLVNNIDALAAL